MFLFVVQVLFVWLAERLWDAVVWPVNLVRDFPVRLGRILQTLLPAGRGLVTAVLALVQAIRTGATSEWLKDTGKGTIGWMYLLLTQIFDLVGGPEIAQFFMHLITHTTPLTADEIALAGSVLGSKALRWGEVRVAEGGLLDLIFRLNGNLAFATWRTVYLPRTGRHTRTNLPILVHELTHVYQYERVGTRYLGEAIYVLVKTRRQCYAYGGEVGLKTAVAAGQRYCHFNREQQAQIIQDYCARKLQGADVSAYEPILAQCRAGDV